MFPLTHVIASKFGAYDSTIEGTTTSADGIAGILKWVPIPRVSKVRGGDFRRSDLAQMI